MDDVGEKTRFVSAVGQTDVSESPTRVIKAPDAALLPLNQIVEGRYRVIALLGEGGMGAVYKVEQIFLKREQALKTLRTSRVSDVSWRRFQKEAKAAALLDHPALVKVHDFGLIEEAQPFFVMDLAAGRTLSAIIKERGALPLDMVTIIFRQLCGGLSYAHDKGIVHRDIKPSNLIIADYGSPQSLKVKIVDFGIAKKLDGEDHETIALTRTGEIFGTPFYMSPEQCLGRAIDLRSDIYSVGCVLFEALTGLPPFFGDTALSTMMQHQSDKPPTLKEATLGQEFPADLEAMVAKLLEKDPRNRYRSLDQLATDIERIAANRPALLGACGEPEPPPQKRRIENPRLLIVAALVLAGTLATGYFLACLTESPRVVQAPAASSQEIYSQVAAELIKPTDRLPPRSQPFSKHETGASWRLFDFGSVPLGEISGTASVDKDDHYLPVHDPLLCGKVYFDNFQGLDIFPYSTLTANPAYFRCFKNDELVGVDFSRSQAVLTNDGLKNLIPMSSLTRLQIIAPNTLNNSAIETINKLPNLSKLALRSAQIDTSGILKLKRLKLMTEIEFHDLKQVDHLLLLLQSSKNLKKLTLDNCEIAANVKVLAPLKQLQSLNLSHNALSDQDLAVLTELPNLEELTLYECPKLTKECLTTIKKLPINLLKISTLAGQDVASMKAELAPIKVRVREPATATDVNAILGSPR